MSLVNNLITRLTPGVTNVPVGDIFNSLKEPDGSLYIRDFDEFVNYLVTDWNAVSGVGTPTRAVTAGLGGLLRISGSAASGDNSYLQRNNPNFQITAGKPLFFEARIAQVDDATNGAYVAGLQIAVAANNFLTPVNGIFFRKQAATTNLEIVSRAASVETTTVLTTIAAATAYRLQFFWDGIGTDVWAAVNGTVLGKVSPAALPSVLMGPTVGEQNGTAAARLLDLDQIFAVQER